MTKPNQRHLDGEYVADVFRDGLATKIRDALSDYAATRSYMRERIAAKSKIIDISKEVLHCATKYIPLDAREFNLATAEVELTDFSDGSQATQDLKLFSLDSESNIKIADWKRVGKLDQRKIEKYRNGDQPWLYIQKAQAQNPDADITFEFRFFVVAFSAGRVPHMHTEIVRLNRAMITEKELEYNLRTQRIKMYNDAGFWPRNSEHCFAYNSTCAFVKDCWRHQEGLTSNDIFHGTLADPIRSQSMDTTETQCPRLYFYSCKAAEKAGDDYHDIGPSGEPAVWGSMFHLGMAMAYEEIQQNHV